MISIFNRERTTLLLIACVGALMASGASADERLGFAYSWVDDGSCPDPAQVAELNYRLAGDDIDVAGNVRSAPSGGDCRLDSISYSVEAERRFDFSSRVAGLVKFTAAERSVSAPYAIVDDAGNIIARPDGMAADPVLLPSGRAQTVIGALGVSYTLGIANIDLGYNLVPVDWSDGSNGRTVHVAVAVTADLLGGVIDGGISFDRGSGGRGWSESRLTWTRQFANSAWGMDIGVRRAAGLSELDAGIPASQTFAGLPAVAAGAASDASTAFVLGISRSF